uniref:Uncharacterized protein n=1 Tax=Anopheles atroparvus TaxID=41427 RepID=A0AAG5DKN9_ANOAO
MPDKTRRDAHKKTDELVEKPKQEILMPKDITPLVTSIMSRLSVNDDSAMHQVGFIVPAKGDEPEKFVTLNELIKEFKTFEDLVLVHEIVIDDDFRLTKAKNKDTIFQMIEQTMHNAFWDGMRQELEQTPPKKERAINLLMDIKKAFRALLAGNNDRALARIEGYLDESKVRQQIEDDDNAVVIYTNFIIGMMGMSCCKARDEEVAELTKKMDLVDRLRGIMETLENMQLDMANYVLGMARSELTKHSIVFERQNLRAAIGDQHAATLAWLKRSYEKNIRLVTVAHKREEKERTGSEDAAIAGPSSESFQPVINIQAILNAAYVELLDPNVTHPLPELLILDSQRIKQMQSQTLRLTICCAVASIARRGGLPTAGPNRKCAADKLMILAKDCTDVAQLKDVLESLWVLVKTMIAEFQEAAGNASEIPDEALLKTEVLKLADDDSRVYSVIKSKLLRYLEEVLEAQTSNQVMLPLIFGDYCLDVIKMGEKFKKIVQHNRAVYDDYYAEQINNF